MFWGGASMVSRVCRAAAAAVVVCACSSAPAATPDAEVFFGGSSPALGFRPNNQLYTLPTAPAGTANLVGPIIPTGPPFISVQGLTSDPRPGTTRLWGIASNEGLVGTDADTNPLLLINPITGAGTVVGDTGLAFNHAVQDIAYDVAHDAMYGAGFDGNMYSVNPSTAAVTLIGPTGVGRLDGLGYGADGKLYGSDLSNKLYLVDTTSGQASLIGNMGARILDLDHRPSDGVMFGVTVGPAPTYPEQVVTINTATGALTFVSDTNVYLNSANDDLNYRLDGAAFLPVPIPEPGMAGVAILASMALKRKRRRRT
jgi:hypothetical protein